MSNRKMTAKSFMEKAERACSSARVLLDLGDVDGASNRAYYAMFDAAGAAILASGAPIDAGNFTRSDSVLIGTFGKHLVQNGAVPKDFARLLNRAHQIRQAADFSGDPIELTVAREMVEKAFVFVAAMRSKFMLEESSDKE